MSLHDLYEINQQNRDPGGGWFLIVLLVAGAVLVAVALLDPGALA